VKPALVVTADAGLRSRLLRELGERSIFSEPEEEKALRVLRAG